MGNAPSFLNRHAIDYLAANVHHRDRGASSHWQRELATFRYAHGRFDGVRGLGHQSPRAVGLRLFAHRLLQRRYRRMGAQFPVFTGIDALADTITARQNRLYDLSALRQTLSLSLLQHMIPKHFIEDQFTLVIGDGYGTLASLLLGLKPAPRVILVNLTPSLLLDLFYIH
ncbi:MAG: hypothetical protein RIB59_11445, partial [Rhodospirillales bacterium]